MMKAHPEWVVLNRGINGQRSDEILARFDRDVQQEHPDCVIILGGVNDVYQGVPAASVRDNILWMYRKALSCQTSPVAGTVLPYNSASASEAKAIRDLNSWIRETASRLEILFCDTNLAVRDPNNPNRLRSSPDGLHPDVYAYRRMGEALAETVESGLRSGMIKTLKRTS